MSAPPHGAATSGPAHDRATSAPPLPRALADRALTWFFTGPAGHFVAGFADWAGLLGRYAWARARGRPPY